VKYNKRHFVQVIVNLDVVFYLYASHPKSGFIKSFPLPESSSKRQRLEEKKKKKEKSTPSDY
jgi:hypothetical protein